MHIGQKFIGGLQKMGEKMQSQEGRQDLRENTMVGGMLGDAYDFATMAGRTAEGKLLSQVTPNGVVWYTKNEDGSYKIDPDEYNALLGVMDLTAMGAPLAFKQGAKEAAKQGAKQATKKALKPTPGQLTRRIAKRADFDRDRIGGILDADNWAIMTAENPGGKAADLADNLKANTRLVKELEERGIEYYPVTGRYGNPVDENSYLILADEKTARQLGKDYGQEAILGPRGMMYSDGSFNPATGVTVHDKPPEDFFSTIGDTPFTVDINFDERIPAPRGAGAPMPGATDVTTLTHYGPQRLDVIDPAMHGKHKRMAGRATTPSATGDRLPRSYWGHDVGAEGGYKPERLYAPWKHEADIPSSSIYNLDEDPMGLVVQGDPGATERAIRDAGFGGLWSDNPQIGRSAVMFDPVTPKSATEVPLDKYGRALAADDPQAFSALAMGKALAKRGVQEEVEEVQRILRERESVDEQANQMSIDDAIERLVRTADRDKPYDLSVEDYMAQKLLPPDASHDERFNAWFRNSVVIDPETMEPKIVYHGSPYKGIEEFKNERIGARDPGFFGRGHYFTPHKDVAEEYRGALGPSMSRAAEGPGSMIDAHLSLQNPFQFQIWDELAMERTMRKLNEMGAGKGERKPDYSTNFSLRHPGQFTRRALEAGYDGAVVYPENPVTMTGIRPPEELVAFDPTQIKSASQNVGTYNPFDPNIFRDRDPSASMALSMAKQGLQDDFTPTLSANAPKGAASAAIIKQAGTQPDFTQRPEVGDPWLSETDPKDARKSIILEDKPQADWRERTRTDVRVGPQQSHELPRGQFYSKGKTTQELELEDALGPIDKDIKAGNYEPFYDPSKRYDADVSQFPATQGKTADLLHSKMAHHRKRINKEAAMPEVLQGLKAAYDKKATDPGAVNWYMMGQLYDDFIATLGPTLGPVMFKQKFMDSMAATTGGMSPAQNWRLAQYGNEMAAQGKSAVPELGAAHQLPTGSGGGKYSPVKNLEQHDKMMRQGYIDLITNPKRHNFSRNFGGDPMVGTLDEQMSELMRGGLRQGRSKAKAFGKTDYGPYEKVLIQEAKAMGITPRQLQEIAWAGHKGDPGKPMIEIINEAIARTSRLTGMDPEEVVRRGIIRSEIPVYSNNPEAMLAVSQMIDAAQRGESIEDMPREDVPVPRGKPLGPHGIPKIKWWKKQGDHPGYKAMQDANERLSPERIQDMDIPEDQKKEFMIRYIMGQAA
jgi:hypothetical protein